MSLSIQSLVRIPKNDQELNVLCDSMNRAYGKHFDLEVGSKKSNNLRNCLCWFLGFRNGGYRQLQSYWQTNAQYDFTDMRNNVDGIVYEGLGGWSAVLSKNVSHAVLDYFCEYFPAGNDGLLNEEQLINEPDLGMEYSLNEHGQWDDYGWSLLHADAVHEKSLQDRSHEGHWYPLYYDQVIIGFAIEIKHAHFLNGLLAQMFVDDALDVSPSFASDDWKVYAAGSLKNETTSPLAYLHLRMESMDKALLLPCEELRTTPTGLEVMFLGSTESLAIDPNESFTYAGQRFDFAQLYANQGASMYLRQKEHDTAIEAFEVFLERIEYRQVSSEEIREAHYATQDHIVVEIK